MKILKIKNVIKYKMYLIFAIIGLIISCTGCKNKTKEEHLSDLLDLKNEKFPEVYYSLFSPPIVQNDKYVYYETNDTKIIRIDKRNHRKKTILKLEKSNELEGGLCLSKDALYYVHDASLYKCSFNGKNVKKIVSKQDLKKLKSIWSIDGVKVYNENIYILVNGVEFTDMILKLHPDSKKFEKVAEVWKPCFYENSLYYIGDGESGIHKVDLDTLEDKLVRGQKWTKEFKYNDEVTRYKGIISNQGKLYYVCYRANDKMTIYSYDESKKDKEEYIFSSNPGDIIYNSTKIAGFRCDWDNSKKSHMQVYDFNTGRAKKFLLPEDYVPNLLVDDIVLCPSLNEKDDFVKGFKIQPE